MNPVAPTRPPDYLTVACPTCNTDAGEPCEWAPGAELAPLLIVHNRRVMSYHLKLQEEKAEQHRPATPART